MINQIRIDFQNILKRLVLMKIVKFIKNQIIHIKIFRILMRNINCKWKLLKWLILKYKRKEKLIKHF